MPAITIKDALHHYMQHHVQPYVIDKARQVDIERNLVDGLGAVVCKQLSARHLGRYCDKRKTGAVGTRKALSDGTLRRELGMLTAALKFCVRDKYLPADHLSHIAMPRRPPARDFWLNEQEGEQLWCLCLDYLSHPELWRGAMFSMLALDTAARRDAIETLRWEQIDLEAKLINFPPSASDNKRKVAVPLSNRLADVLGKIRKSSGFVIDGRDCFRAFKSMCRLAAKRHDNKRFLRATPHSLRHTWATQAARAGVDLWQIAGVLGDRVDTVVENYAHHHPDHLRAAVNFR